MLVVSGPARKRAARHSRDISSGATAIHPFLHPNAEIVEGPGGPRLAGTALTRAIAARAGVLAGLGVGRGDRVALAHGRGASFLVDLFAVWQRGANALGLSPGMAPAEKVNVAATLRPAAWIGEAPPSGPLSLAPQGLGELASAGPEGSMPDEGATLDEVALDEVALVLATSGTTAQPKGVVLTHRALAARLALNVAHIGAGDLARGLVILPLHFGHGLIGNALSVLAAGGRLVVWPDAGPRGLSRLGETVAAEGITFLSSVPAHWQVVLKTSAPPPAGILRRVHVGSAPLASTLWESIVAWCGTRRVVNMYGITECANWIAGASAENEDLGDGLVGRAWGGRLAVRDETGRLRASGRGEVAVASPSLMQGYLDQPEATAAALRGGWFMTGDLGEIDGDGRLRLVGRLKHEINRAGVKIPAEEIDLLLERHPDVAEACAFGLPDPLFGETVAAAVVGRGAQLDAAALRRWCADRIRADAVPSRLYVLEQLPRTDRGKLNRDRVREACLAAAAAPAPDAGPSGR